MERRQPEPGDSPESSTSSWSPPELYPYNLQQQTLRCKRFKMSHECAGWNNELIRYFLNLCITEKAKLNFTSKKRLTKEGWQNVYKEFNKNTGRSYSLKQLQNKFNALKSQHKENQQAGHSERKPFQHELENFFGDMDTQGGKMLFAGGIGHRMPSGGHEDRSHRSGREHEVDSTPRKRPGKRPKSQIAQIMDNLLSHYVDCAEKLDYMAKQHAAAAEEKKKMKQKQHWDYVKNLAFEAGVKAGTKEHIAVGCLIKDKVMTNLFLSCETPAQRLNFIRCYMDRFMDRAMK